MSEDKKVRLYQFSALLSYHVVVAATSEQEAKAHIDNWPESWWSRQELQKVADVDLFRVCEVEQVPETISARANEVTIESQLFLHSATLSEPTEVKP